MFDLKPVKSPRDPFKSQLNAALSRATPTTYRPTAYSRPSFNCKLSLSINGHVLNVDVAVDIVVDIVVVVLLIVAVVFYQVGVIRNKRQINGKHSMRPPAKAEAEFR